MKAILCVVLFAAVAGLLLPIFLPPLPIYPSPISFAPITLFVACLWMTASRHEDLELMCVLTPTVIIGGWLQLDTIRFNVVFSWEVCGFVLLYVPIAQTALAAGMVCVFLRRRMKRPEGRSREGSNLKYQKMRNG